MAGFSAGKLWNVKKGDLVKVNALQLHVEKVDAYDPDDEEHEEQTKEIFLKGKDGEYLIEISDSLRTFYHIVRPDSFTTKKHEIAIETIHPE